MKLVYEILLDNDQLSEEDIKRIMEKTKFDLEDSLLNVFWYRENKALDYEISLHIQD